MYLMVQCFVDHMVEVVAFGTIAVVISTRIIVFFNGPVKQVPGFFYLVANFWKINKTERGPVFFNEMVHGYSMEGQGAIPQIKSFLGEVIGLLD